MQNVTRYFLLLLLGFGGLSLSGQQVGTYLTETGVRFEALTYASPGHFYSLDYWTGNIYKISPGPTVTNIISGMANPVGGAMDNDGNFYFSELGTGKIHKVMPDNSHHEFASGFAGPTGIALAPTGDTLYVASYNNNTIRKVALSDSSVHNFAVGGGINGPDGLVFAPNGDLIVANFDDNRVHRIDPAGNVSLFSTLGGSPNSGYITRINNTYFITGFNGHRVWRLDSAGNSSWLAGNGMPGYVDGPGAQAEFTRPNGIATNANGDTLWVTQGNVTGHLRIITDFDLITQVEAPQLEAISLEVLPNPATDRSVIRFELAAADRIQISVHNAQGQLVMELVEENLNAGPHEITLGDSIPGLPAGAYFCRMQVGEAVTATRFIVPK